MRRAVYNLLLKAPFKVVVGLSGLVGFVASVWPEKVKAIVDAGLPTQTIGIALLIIAVLYVSGLWMLKPGEVGATTTERAVATTGNHSHAISAAGDVHIHAPPLPAEQQERKSPYGGWTDKGLSGLERVMQGNGKRGTLASEVERIQQAQHDRCPELPVHRALRQIAANIGDKDNAKGYPEARRQFRQSALEGRLDVWGRRQIPPQHFQDNRSSGVWTRIAPSHWEDHALAPHSVNKAGHGLPHTEEENRGLISSRYWSLKVRPEEINRQWPKSPLATDAED